MARKPKATTVQGAVTAMQAVLSPPIEPPWPLPAESRPIWVEIIGRRARDEWQAIDLRFAWELAELLGRLRMEHEALSGEDSVIKGKANPRHRLIGDLEGRALGLARYLRIHPASEVNRPQHLRGKRQAQRQAAEAIGAVTGTSFLAN